MRRFTILTALLALGLAPAAGCDKKSDKKVEEKAPAKKDDAATDKLIEKQNAGRTPGKAAEPR